jgi:hypothetical protein
MCWSTPRISLLSSAKNAYLGLSNRVSDSRLRVIACIDMTNYDYVLAWCGPADRLFQTRLAHQSPLFHHLHADSTVRRLACLDLSAEQRPISANAAPGFIVALK